MGVELLSLITLSVDQLFLFAVDVATCWWVTFPGSEELGLWQVERQRLPRAVCDSVTVDDSSSPQDRRLRGEWIQLGLSATLREPVNPAVLRIRCTQN